MCLFSRTLRKMFFSVVNPTAENAFSMYAWLLQVTGKYKVAPYELFK